MEKVSLNPTVELEHKLINFYKKINHKEITMAKKLERVKKTDACNKAHHVLFLHIGLNLITVSGLFFLLY
jgi:hypothetical protein